MVRAADKAHHTTAAGWGFKVGAADKAHYPAAAVDAEFGRVGPAADAVRHHRTGHIGVKTGVAAAV